jgi:DNA-binding transcriptional ArsR family regulator
MWRTSPVSYIYNPLNQTEEELLKNYVVREREFNTIFDDIKGSDMSHPEPHYIIQGQRGQGKTTLLLKIYYEIKKDKELSTFVIPIMFNEEQYHIDTLFGLWSHTAEKLEEENQDFSGLYDSIESAYENEGPEMEAFNLLEGALKEKKRKLILLIDNIGQFLDKLPLREQQRLREVLITSPEIRIIGASAFVLEYTYDYSKPFYELFRIITLEGLAQKEAIKLLLKLGEHYKQENIKKIIEEEPGRVETLRRLTGGVPRTIVLLFEIFVDDENRNAFLDLEFILDRVTPLYKHRMDDLSTQQQKIVDAIALNWDAMPAKDIAQKTKMESKAVSSHLKLLEKNRVINKIRTTTKNYLYQVNERFFNIWYLMRYGRKRGRNRIQWLVHFLQSWCSEAELADRAQKHIHALEKTTLYPKHAFYLTGALASTNIPDLLQHRLIVHTRHFLKEKDKALASELSKSDIELGQEAVEYYKKGKYQETIRCFETMQNKITRIIGIYNISFGLLVINEIEKSLDVQKKLMKDEEYNVECYYLIDSYMILLMAKKQYYAALKLFEENLFDLKERVKPIYYALMHFLKDDFPNEYKKMGAELKETVEEIIEKVKQWEKE